MGMSDTFNEKNLKFNDMDIDNIQIEKMSDTSGESFDNKNMVDDGSGSIGLDLLANQKKVMKVEEKKENHEEIDLIKNNKEEEEEEEKHLSENLSSPIDRKTESEDY